MLRIFIVHTYVMKFCYLKILGGLKKGGFVAGGEGGGAAKSDASASAGAGAGTGAGASAGASAFASAGGQGNVGVRKNYDTAFNVSQT